MIKDITKLEKIFTDLKSQKESIKKDIYITKLEELCKELIDTGKVYKEDYNKANESLIKALDKIILMQK